MKKPSPKRKRVPRDRPSLTVARLDRLKSGFKRRPPEEQYYVERLLDSAEKKLKLPRDNKLDAKTEDEVRELITKHGSPMTAAQIQTALEQQGRKQHLETDVLRGCIHSTLQRALEKKILNAEGRGMSRTYSLPEDTSAGPASHDGGGTGATPIPRANGDEGAPRGAGKQKKLPPKRRGSS